MINIEDTLYADPSIVSYDETSFEWTADVILALNEVAQRRFKDREHLIDWMKVQTLLTLKGAGYWGTMGFYVSCCRKAGDDGWYCMASVSPWLVKENLVQKVLAK